MLGVWILHLIQHNVTKFVKCLWFSQMNWIVFCEITFFFFHMFCANQIQPLPQQISMEVGLGGWLVDLNFYIMLTSLLPTSTNVHGGRVVDLNFYIMLNFLLPTSTNVHGGGWVVDLNFYIMLTSLLPTSTNVHGGGGWSEHLRNANFHTKNPDLPTVDQYFSTVYKPAIIKLKSQKAELSNYNPKSDWMRWANYNYHIKLLIGNNKTDSPPPFNNVHTSYLSYLSWYICSFVLSALKYF